MKRAHLVGVGLLSDGVLHHFPEAAGHSAAEVAGGGLLGFEDSGLEEARLLEEGLLVLLDRLDRVVLIATPRHHSEVAERFHREELAGQDLLDLQSGLGHRESAKKGPEPAQELTRSGL